MNPVTLTIDPNPCLRYRWKAALDAPTSIAAPTFAAAPVDIRANVAASTVSRLVRGPT